jgi:hypothetical protein
VWRRVIVPATMASIDDALRPPRLVVVFDNDRLFGGSSLSHRQRQRPGCRRNDPPRHEGGGIGMESRRCCEP